MLFFGRFVWFVGILFGFIGPLLVPIGAQQRRSLAERREGQCGEGEQCGPAVVRTVRALIQNPFGSGQLFFFVFLAVFLGRPAGFPTRPALF